VDLNEVIEGVKLLLDGELARRQVAFHTTLFKDLPRVLGDRVQLEQVILNLAVNASEAMTESMRPRELEIRTEMQGPTHIKVTVQDSGPGLPVSDPEQMFAAFFTTKPGGLGMGLSISRTIIEAHGGSIWAVNTTRGAAFQFRLPVN
jgi:C4-dicarboxylate-specific signal transduction histidine kinase